MASTTDRGYLATPYSRQPLGNVAETRRELALRFPRHVRSKIMRSPNLENFWRPSTDVYETEDDITIHVDLPGIPKDAIHITLHPTGQENYSRLEIHGESSSIGKEEFPTATSRIRERKIGKFRKWVYLPPVNVDGIKATYRDGLLEVVVPKQKATAEGDMEITIE
jgi:HSP20 family protein